MQFQGCNFVIDAAIVVGTIEKMIILNVEYVVTVASQCLLLAENVGIL